MKKMMIALLVICFFMPSLILAEELVFGVVEWPPLVIVEKNQVSGISIDITREICHKNGITPKFKILPLKRALKYLEEGKICMSSLFHTPERESFLYYPSESQYKVINVIVTFQKNNKKIKSLEDFKGESVGIMDGYNYSDAFNQNSQIKKYHAKTLEELMRLLIKGRIKFAAVEANGFRYMCKKWGIKKNAFTEIYTLSEKPFYTVFPKKMGKKGEELSKIFNDSLKKMKKQGRIQKILDNYL